MTPCLCPSHAKNHPKISNTSRMWMKQSTPTLNEGNIQMCRAAQGFYVGGTWEKQVYWQLCEHSIRRKCSPKRLYIETLPNGSHRGVFFLFFFLWGRLGGTRSGRLAMLRCLLISTKVNTFKVQWGVLDQTSLPLYVTITNRSHRENGLRYATLDFPRFQQFCTSFFIFFLNDIKCNILYNK